MINNNKGITIVALVVTIIILLIIAGVSISMIMGDNGIVTRATEVELEYSKAEVLESLEMKVNNKLLEAYEHIKASPSTDISTVYNEINLLTYFDNAKDNAEAPGIDCIDPYGTEKIANVSENGEVYKIYLIKPTALSEEIKKYGAGENTEKGDIFTLEVVEKAKEDGTKISSGEYEIKYYDENGKSEVLGKINLYQTNNS